MSTKQITISSEFIASKIYYIREHKVMLDIDLANLYGVETKRLKEAVRRNIKRFPADFMFELNKDENQSLRTQFATLKRGQHSKYLPFAFTEHGILMLSSVLNSKRAIEVNIQIMRIFTKLRKMIANNTKLNQMMKEMEKKIDKNTQYIQVIFKMINQLEMQPDKMKKIKGFSSKNGK